MLFLEQDVRQAMLAMERLVLFQCAAAGEDNGQVCRMFTLPDCDLRHQSGTWTTARVGEQQEQRFASIEQNSKRQFLSIQLRK